MLGLVLMIGFACWCWIGRGPLVFRWPLIVLIVLMTSGHWLGEIIGAYVSAFAGPLLLFVIVMAGFMVMLRGIGWRPQRHYHRDNHHRRGWYDDHR